MRRWPALAAALCLGTAVCIASTAAAQSIHVRVVRREAVAWRFPQRLRPNVAYAGTVTTLPDETGEVSSVAYDTVDGDFYGTGGEIFFEVLPDGSTNRISNFFSWGFPVSMVWDPNTQLFYVTDGYDVLTVTPQGTVALLAGSGSGGTQDGQGSHASFQGPSGIALDPVNHYLYVADVDRLRRVDESGNVLTVGPTQGFGSQSLSVAFDTATDEVAIADPSLDIIHSFDTTTASYRILAGACVQQLLGSPGCVALHLDGRGTHALFAGIAAIAYDPSSNAYYVNDLSNDDIRKVDTSGNVTTFAGNGTSADVDGVGLSAEFYGPSCEGLNPVTHTLLVCDGGVSRVVTTTGQIPPPPSNDLPLVQTPSLVSGPMGITTASDGSLWFPENVRASIGRYLPSSGKFREFPLPGGHGNPYGPGADARGNVWFGDFTDLNGFGTGANPFIARISPNGAVRETAFQNGCSALFLNPDSLGGAWFANQCIAAIGYENARQQIGQFLTPTPTGIILGSDYLWAGASSQIEKYSFTGETIATFVGADADSGIALGPDGDIWYLSNRADSVGDLDPTTGTTTVFELPTPQCGCSRNLANPEFGSDGALWFTVGPVAYPGNYYPGGLGRLTTTGVYQEYRTYEPRSQPTGITKDQTGRLWFSDFGANKLGYVQ